jgi:2-polyprenyl-3-methyl-5-hydroxy-6-metoxy-1,4-benzoquinol methylase
MWDERYGTSEFASGTEPNDWVRENAGRIQPGGRVLCLAAGEGRNAAFLAAKGHPVTAVDQSRVGMEKAARLARDAGVELTTVVADLAHHDLGRSAWAAITSVHAHMPVPVRQDLHRRVVEALAPGGLYILEAYTERQLDMPGRGGPPLTQREMFMSLAGLREELAGLEFVVGREVDREVSEGRYHTGESAVVQVLARKPD